MIHFCFVLIDLINDYKIVCIMVFMRIFCIMVFYVHCYFLKLFLSMKRDYGIDDFYTNYYFYCEKVFFIYLWVCFLT